MANQPDHDAYDRRYDQTRASAAAWPTWRLSYVLHFMVPVGRYSEDAWGAIDALTDLIQEAAAVERPDAGPS